MPLFELALSRASAALPRDAKVVLVGRRGDRGRFLRTAERVGVAADFVVGGATRAASARAGARALLRAGADPILIHDAARPLLSRAVVRRLLAALARGADAAVPGIAPVDTIKEVRGCEVVRTPPRDRLVAVQTPQALTAAAARRAFGRRFRAEATDDVSLLEGTGARIVLVAGDPGLLKVTTREDVKRFVNS